jgi:hypothetical protein
VNPLLQVGLSILSGALVQLLIGVAFLGMMRQQLTDLVGWVKGLAQAVKELERGQMQHEGRLSRIEGHLGLSRD